MDPSCQLSRRGIELFPVFNVFLKRYEQDRQRGARGARSEINLGQLLTRRLAIIGSTLRARPLEEKARLAAAFADRFGTALDDGTIFPVIDRVLDLADAREAHRVLKASEHFGKVVLRVP